MFLKRTFLAALFLSTCFFAQAQFEKGSILFGVGLGYRFEANNDLSSLGGSVGTLDFGYFVKDRWAIGMGLTMNNFRTEERKFLDYNFDIFSRYYFTKNNRLNFYGEAFAGFGQRKFNYEDLEISGNSFNMNYGVGAGVDYRITKNMRLDLGLRYTANEFFDNSSINRNRLSAKVGLKFNLRGKRKK